LFCNSKNELRLPVILKSVFDTNFGIMSDFRSGRPDSCCVTIACNTNSWKG